MASSSKRTTVVLEESDQDDLEVIARRLRISDMESFRRSLRITAKLLSMSEEDGELLLVRPSGEQVMLVIL